MPGKTFDVANQLASSRQRQVVGLLCLTVCLSAVLALPVGAKQLAVMPHVAGIYGASAAMINLATFWLLMSAVQPSRPLRIIAAGYLFAGLMAVLHVLTFPGALLTDASVLGNGNTVSWLFIAWRAGFQLFVLWAVIAEVSPSPNAEGASGFSPALIALLAAVASLLAGLVGSEVPALVPGPQGQQFSTLSLAGSYLAGVVSVVTLAVILRFGLAWRSLYLWLMLTLVAETVGVWFSTFSGGRYTVAWYGARAEGLAVGFVVLGLIAAHFRDLQSRLNKTVVELSQRTDALQAEMQHRELAERMLVQSQKLEAVGQLAAGLAHDINNFMQVIATRTELMRRRIGESVEPDVAVIKRNVRRAEQLTRQLLLFSGRRQMAPEVVWLQRSVPPFVEAFRAVLGTATPVRLELQTDAWAVFVDPTELEVALANLLTNARDALGPGGQVTVSVANHRDAQGRERVLLEIVDNGRGIPEAVLERVFEPFFTTKGPGKGSGLGLSQVYAFARGSGGDVVVQSRPGQGTTIRIDLPRHGEAGALQAEAAPAREHSLAGRVVLLVDDNADVLEATSALLEQAGLIVKTASGVPAAMALLEGGLHPDVVVSDIVMTGERDGVALALHCRARHPAVRVILATGYSSAAAEAASQGFEVLAKPYDATVLLRLIDAAAGKPRA